MDGSQVSRVLPQRHLNIDKYTGVSPSMRDSRDLLSRLLETWRARLLSRLDDLWLKWSLKSDSVPGSKAACQETELVWS